VPGAPQLWFEEDVPHGVVHEHWYQSSATGTLRNVLVYTPPGYDAAAATSYPVLYLLHGLGDDARNWTMVGRAHVILDNLIAGRKAVPMLIVMPDGIVPRSAGNSDRVFEQDLMENVKPLIESQYRVSKAREDRAIAGLSMGGGQALTIGLPHLDQFAYVGSFSSGNLASGGVTRYAQFLADPAAANRQLRAFYISCGSADNRLEGTRKFDQAPTEKGIDHVFHVIPGGHAYVVFRRNLAEFAQMLFHKEGRP
jgi:enterochelin esterase family protein